VNSTHILKCFECNETLDVNSFIIAKMTLRIEMSFKARLRTYDFDLTVFEVAVWDDPIRVS